MYNEKLKELIMKANSQEAIVHFNQMLKERRECLDEYKGEDKREILEKVKERDEKLIKVMEEKMKTIMSKMIHDDERDKNRETFKLYE